MSAFSMLVLIFLVVAINALGISVANADRT